MKKIFMLIALGITVLIVSNCNPAKRAAKKIPKSTYETNLSVVILNNCSPCHIPSRGGNKKPYDNYANVREDIDQIIRRINLSPGQKDFMPFRNPKLSDSTIAVFTKWKADGMLEK
jgi:uncharacterized membrane protein